MRGTCGYSRLVDTILGLLGLFLFVVVITSLAAGVTWLVVRLFPPQDKKPQPESS